VECKNEGSGGDVDGDLGAGVEGSGEKMKGGKAKSFYKNENNNLETVGRSEKFGAVGDVGGGEGRGGMGDSLNMGREGKKTNTNNNNFIIDSYEKNIIGKQ
jgi:hypothetical protein